MQSVIVQLLVAVLLPAAVAIVAAVIPDLSGLVPVFLVRPGGRRVQLVSTVLAAVDGSPGGAQALDEATNLCRQSRAKLILVRVVPPPESFGFDPLLHTTLLGSTAHEVVRSSDRPVLLVRRTRRRSRDVPAPTSTASV